MVNAPNTGAATVEDFKKWEEAAKACSNEQLLHIIRDCREAAQAMKTWNPVREGYYEDQAWTFADEYRKRTRTQL